MEKRARSRLVLYGISLAVLAGGTVLTWRGGPSFSLPGGMPEIAEVGELRGSFQDFSSYFKALAEKKGAEYAFRVLKAAPLPPNLDLHLLGHTVGDVLYKERGLEGIKICTNDFRNACSHSIVVGLFYDKGTGALDEISDACRKAPGGSGAYTMCFHGLGHGILAYTGYELPKAVELCRLTGTAAYQEREYIECVGGTVMEIIGGGGHDPTAWQRKSREYLAGNPLALCLADFMPASVRPICFTYLTPHLFAAAGADLGYPMPDDYQKAFTFCGALPREGIENREACYGGFGKEFVVLAQNRDIRKIEEMTDPQLFAVYEWCRLANEAEGTEACIRSAMNSLYWGGENNRETAIRFCGLIDEQRFQSACFRDLIEAVAYYIDSRAYRRAFCTELPSPHRGECRAKLEGV